MKAVLFGATGMIGQGVLRECLRDPEVAGVLSIVRRPSGVRDPKLREVVHSDFTDSSGLPRGLTGGSSRRPRSSPRAMIRVAAHGYERPIIESGDIGAILGKT